MEQRQQHVVDDFDDVHPNACILPHWIVSAIAVVPGGAFPSYAHGYYARHNAFYLAWDEVSRDRDRFGGWIDEHVMRQGPEAFAARAGRMTWA